MHDFDSASQYRAAQGSTSQGSTSQGSTTPNRTFAGAEFPSDAALWRTMLERRSIRRYTGQPVSTAVIESLLEAARWAPSAHNRQPWRFCVVRTPECRERLVDSMAARWQADLVSDGVDEAVIESRVGVRSERMRKAPVLILAALCVEELDAYPDARRQEAERIMGVQSVALACQNLLLAAQAHGLGACWMCAPLFAPETVREALDLPESWEPQALISAGYPAEVRTKERNPIASRTLWR